MKTNISPAIIAASIAGGSIGSAVGFMTKGEELENMGKSTMIQLGGGIVGSVTHGVAGIGIGAGISGTAVALKSILRK